MVTKKEALQIAKNTHQLISKNGYTEIYDIGENDGFYGFNTTLDPDEDYATNMLCISKKDGAVSWLGGGYLYTTYDMTKITKERI